MSTWRRKAIETFPDLRQEFEKPSISIYGVFFELLPRVRDVHARGDTAELHRICDFARWCFEQEHGDLSNAAAVAFNEHLVDERGTRDEIPRWLPPKIFKACEPLFQARLTPDEFMELGETYRLRGTQFRLTKRSSEPPPAARSRSR
jgi:hypothetical protein